MLTFYLELEERGWATPWLVLSPISRESGAKFSPINRQMSSRSFWIFCIVMFWSSDRNALKVAAILSYTMKWRKTKQWRSHKCELKGFLSSLSPSFLTFYLFSFLSFSSSAFSPTFSFPLPFLPFISLLPTPRLAGSPENYVKIKICA